MARAISLLAEHHPDAHASFLLLDTTPVPTGRSIPTLHRSELVGSASVGYCASHTRWYIGYKLVLFAAPDGFPLAYDLVPAGTNDLTAARAVLPDVPALSGRTVLGDRAFRGLEAALAACGGVLLRPLYQAEIRAGAVPDKRISRVRQWIESIFWTLKDQLSLERHGGRTLEGSRSGWPSGYSRSGPRCGTTPASVNPADTSWPTATDFHTDRLEVAHFDAPLLGQLAQEFPIAQSLPVVGGGVEGAA